MLTHGEYVAVFDRSKEHEGIVLGVEGAQFWLWVPSLNQIHRGHVDKLYQLTDGKRFLDAAEWTTTVDDVFNTNGEFRSEVFWASSEPEPMIKRLKIYRLIGA